MVAKSNHLEQIMTKHNRIANIQVVFVDIEKYSKRRTLTQIEVIDRFTSSLNSALINTSRKYIQYAQINGINFTEDVIVLPTGDGAAVVFSFDGLHDIHLHFAKCLLESIHAENISTPCEKYNDHGWCNCHSNFGVRIGISEGKGIIYKDSNGNFNVAGGVINFASRVMGLADKNQIMFTKEAYTLIVDMVDEPDLVNRFVEIRNVRIKHGIEVDVYQYTGEGEPYINSNPPEDLTLIKRAEEALDKLKNLGMPNLKSTDMGLKGLVGMFEGIANALPMIQRDDGHK
jgi:hypothetical protein